MLKERMILRKIILWTKRWSATLFHQVVLLSYSAFKTFAVSITRIFIVISSDVCTDCRNMKAIILKGLLSIDFGMRNISGKTCQQLTVLDCYVFGPIFIPIGLDFAFKQLSFCTWILPSLQRHHPHGAPHTPNRTGPAAHAGCSLSRAPPVCRGPTC